jgi:hypothetical protein
MLALGLGLGSTARADTMECYNGILDTAAPEPPTKDTVRQRCGEPDAETDQGYQWIYRKQEYSYVLRFNGEDELLDIQKKDSR